MARSPEQIASLEKMGIKTLKAGFQDLDVIGAAVEKHDVHIYSRYPLTLCIPSDAVRL